LAFAQFLII